MFVSTTNESNCTEPALYLGDCIEQMKTLPSGSIDLIVTSPPYPNMGMKYGGRTGADRFTDDEYVQFSRAWLREAARLLAANGSIWINVGWVGGKKGSRVPLPYLLWPLLSELGLHLQQEIVWAKPNRPSPNNIRFTTRTERWLWLTKAPRGHTFNLDAVRTPRSQNVGDDKRNHPLGANPTDIWEFAPVNGNAKDRPNHPCPFPLPMIERIVNACSNPGDVVLDPMMGSGTTGVAALRNDRKFVGIEREPTYFGEATARIHAAERGAWAAERARLSAEIIELQTRVRDLASGQPAKPIRREAKPPRGERPPRSNINSAEIVRLLATGGAMSIDAIFKRFGGRFDGSRAIRGKMSRGTVQNVMRALVEAGEAEIVAGSGIRCDPFRYRLKNPPQPVHPAPRTARPHFRFIDHFAGAGGFHLALSSLGGECVAATETDQFAAQTYRANFGREPMGDLRSIQPHDLPAADIWTAGLPCQSHSRHGNRLGMADPRGTLFFNVAELARIHRPRAILIENVPEFRHVLPTVRSTLTAIGYTVHDRVLDALDFGLPQRRKRMIVVALQGWQSTFRWPDPVGWKPDLATVLDPLGDPKLRLSDARKAALAELARQQGRTIFSPAIWQKSEKSLTLKEFSGTLRADPSREYLTVDGERLPSPRELAAFQGFPPDFKIVVSRNQFRRQMGNAVPVPLIRAVGEQVLFALGMGETAHAMKLAS